MLRMLAHHPETGQPIRILRSDAQITQSRRTLVWLQADYNVSPRWQRWNTLLTDPAVWVATAAASAEAATQCGLSPTALIITDYSKGWGDVLRAVGDTCLVVYRNGAVEDALKKAGFPAENYLSYEDLYHMYPFLGEPVRAGDCLEKVVLSVAHILRFPYLAWTPTEASLADTGVKAQLQAWQRTCAGQLVGLPAAAVAEDHVPACWLIQQYFRHPLTRRAREIATCLEKNVANPYIDKILLMNEQEHTTLPTSDKIIQKVIGRRATYLDVLEAIRTDLPAGAFAIFANADIWCDGSLQVLWNVPLKERRLFLALLRWEDTATATGQEPQIFGPRPDSQDTWIIAKDTVDFVPTEDEFGFPFGKPGCDNAIALAMLKKRCLVVNPAYSLKTFHLHASNVRDYNPRDILYKPAYLYLDPTHIQLFAVEQQMKAWETKHHGGTWRVMQPRRSFTRKIACVSETAAKTVCRAIKDREHDSFQPAGAANMWTPSPNRQPLYEMRDTFVSDTGLLSNFQSIFVGGHDVWRAGWQASAISSVSTTLHVPAMISATTDEACWKSLATWCLQYLPTALRLRKAADTEYEFLVPTLPEVPAFLYDCRWRDPHIGTIPHIPNTQYFCNKLLAPAPADTKEHGRVCAEDVDILRELLPPYPACVGGITTVVVCLDDAIFTDGWVSEWKTCQASLLRGVRVLTVKATDAPRTRREAFQAADWVFGSKEALRWVWMARPGTRIVEWMLETDISSEIIHLAGAAQCTYILSLVRKEPVEYQREHAIIEFGKIWSTFAFKETTEALVAAKPRVYLPTGKAARDMWQHVGDGFREMVRLWGERGYCEVLETEESSYVWWGNVGETMLYDWKSGRWWEPNTNYQLALFGQSALPGPEGHETRQSVWSFWALKPRLLEEVVERGRLTWSERTIGSLFLGKVENGVQKAHRCAADWSAAVDLFSMPVDSTGAPYPYTHSEYLEKLRQARFGLCLPGYAAKCHREMEYMALGVVPVVTPGVDMSGYLVPPQEGVHFLRAATPEAVRQVIAATSPETWEVMSAACQTWWRENASAEGLFRLTWARIEQCKPLQGLIIPPWPAVRATAGATL